MYLYTVFDFVYRTPSSDASDSLTVVLEKVEQKMWLQFDAETKDVKNK